MNTTRATINLTEQAFRNLGLSLPKKMTDEIARVTAALADRGAFTPNLEALGNATAEAMIDGRDPLTDPAVDLELKRQQLATLRISEHLDAVIERRRAALVNAHLPAIIDALAGVVKEADAALHEAREAIPGLDLTDPAFGSLVPPSKLPLWGNARRAADRASTAAQTWTLLASALNFGREYPSHRPLILADLTATERDALGREAKADAALHAGHRISLATPEVFTERVRRVVDGRAALETERLATQSATQGARHRFIA
ncbi:hypothetical protein [uncultured Phycicoccus sp.]|uniref:hypothetical protein n=1 Tax=uncultured Phycicoccus sp. TaxID=661422 RepID=UPI00262C249C|nr:hypothetical protein [uncultured Phycicoccus sp.]